jgi:hypothetical protein
LKGLAGETKVKWEDIKSAFADDKNKELLMLIAKDGVARGKIDGFETMWAGHRERLLTGLNKVLRETRDVAYKLAQLKEFVELKAGEGLKVGEIRDVLLSDDNKGLRAELLKDENKDWVDRIDGLRDRLEAQKANEELAEARVAAINELVGVLGGDGTFDDKLDALKKFNGDHKLDLTKDTRVKDALSEEKNNDLLEAIAKDKDAVVITGMEDLLKEKKIEIGKEVDEALKAYQAELAARAAAVAEVVADLNAGNIGKLKEFVESHGEEGEGQPESKLRADEIIGEGKAELDDKLVAALKGESEIVEKIEGLGVKIDEFETKEKAKTKEEAKGSKTTFVSAKLRELTDKKNQNKDKLKEAIESLLKEEIDVADQEKTAQANYTKAPDGLKACIACLYPSAIDMGADENKYSSPWRASRAYKAMGRDRKGNELKGRAKIDQMSDPLKEALMAIRDAYTDSTERCQAYVDFLTKFNAVRGEAPAQIEEKERVQIMYLAYHEALSNSDKDLIFGKTTEENGLLKVGQTKLEGDEFANKVVDDLRNMLADGREALGKGKGAFTKTRAVKSKEMGD